MAETDHRDVSHARNFCDTGATKRPKIQVSTHRDTEFTESPTHCLTASVCRDRFALRQRLAVKLKEMPPEMATLVLFDSSGLEIVRPTPT